MRALDAESAVWVDGLSAGGAESDSAQRRLHGMLLRIARSEVNRRSGSLRLGGPEVDDLAHQAASDAMLAVLAKLADFRGESRFTTWAYRFVVLEVSSKLGRHFWRRPTTPFDAADWERLPALLGADPAEQAEAGEVAAAIGRIVEHDLSAHQRQVFVAIAVEGVPLDALAVRLATNRNALYKVMFDARRKIRAGLVANGYLEGGDERG